MSIKEQIHPTQKKWYVACCKYKCEKRLDEDFAKRGIECYVPLQRRTKLLKTGRKEVTTPLIPSHIFIHIDQGEYIEVIRHPHVYQFLNFSGKIVPVRNEEMKMMKRVVGEIEDVQIERSGFCEGERVEIVSGELTGLKGVLTKKDNYNFRVVLESLGMGLEISVNPKHLIRLGAVSLVA